MPHEVQLELDGKTYEVLRCVWKFEQTPDPNGEPASGVIGGYIRLIMEGSNEDGFDKWICNPAQTMDGKVSFYVDESKFKTLEFKNAYLVRLHESYHMEDRPALSQWESEIEIGDPTEQMNNRQVEEYHQRTGLRYLMQCAISAEKLILDGVEHDNNW